MGMPIQLTINQIKNIAEIVLEKLLDDLYDEEVNLVAQATRLAENELEKLEVEWSDHDIDHILDEVEIYDLEEHRKEVLYVNKIGTYASLGLSQADFI